MGKNNNTPDWGAIFDRIVRGEVSLASSYWMFHKFSLGNQALAMCEMMIRGIPIGPIATFNAWRKAGRIVKKGEKAISLWMPVTTEKEVTDPKTGEVRTVSKRFFIMRPRWFAYAQTEPMAQGEDGPLVVEQAIAAAVPQWDKTRALAALGLREVPFEHVNGTVLGYARPDEGVFALSPLLHEQDYLHTVFHEMGHCLLHKGLTGGIFEDGQDRGTGIMEVEAEATAFLCLEALGLPGLERARGYILAWMRKGGHEVVEQFRQKGVARAFHAADRILKAGMTKAAASDEDEALEEAA
jgi:antirestriction protein ArdC